MLLIIVIACSLKSYKIETFADYLSLPPFISLDSMIPNTAIPQNPADIQAYTYLRDVKKWYVDGLTNNQKKVLFTMVALQGQMFGDDAMAFPYKNAIVIPNINFPIYGRLETDKTDLYLDNTITLQYSDNDFPAGWIIPLADQNFDTLDKLKKVLNMLYELYDAEYLDEIINIKSNINLYKAQHSQLESQLQGIKSETMSAQASLDELLNPFSQYSKDKNRAQALYQEIAQLDRERGDAYSRYNEIVGITNDGWRQINSLWNC